MIINARVLFPKKHYPFSDELCAFMTREPNFYNSLKISLPQRFIFIQCMIISRTPCGHQYSQDEVIGLWYFDKYRFNKTAQFKQDFIVNKTSMGREFVSYTAKHIVKRFPSKYVRAIGNFFLEYGNNGTYYHCGGKWSHHYNNLQDLPYEQLRIRARRIITKY